MKIFYFQGWGEGFDQARYNILSKFGDDVKFPSIDYQNCRNLINSYSNEVYGKQEPTLIIGNALGAYFSHYISDIVKFPALLFNPTFFYKNGGEMRPNSNSIGSTCMEKQFVFSSKSDEVDVKRCYKFLKEFKYEDDKIKMLALNQIPLDVFENEFTEFREKYKNIVEKSVSKSEQKKQYIEEMERLEKKPAIRRAREPKSIAGNYQPLQGITSNPVIYTSTSTITATQTVTSTGSRLEDNPWDSDERWWTQPSNP